MVRSKGQLLQATIDALKRNGHEAKPVPTTGPNTAAAIVRECINEGADVILAAGGDGTINEIVNGMIGSQVPLGILPVGTANVLACEMGMRTHAPSAADLLASAVPARIAAGRISGGLSEGRHFLLMAGIGLDAMIVYNIDAEMKAKLGKVAYWIGGFQQLGKKLIEFDVRVNGDTHRCSFALASRVRNYGGDLNIARQVTLFAEDFEVVLFKGANSLPYLKYFAGVLVNQLPRLSGVEVLRTRALEVSAAADPRVYIQIDGEYAGRGPAKFEIVPDAVTLLVPPEFHSRRNG